MLESDESRSTIEKAVDASSSILIRDIDSSQKDKVTDFPEETANMDFDFCFDRELLHNRAYKRALVPLIRQVIHQTKRTAEALKFAGECLHRRCETLMLQ